MQQTNTHKHNNFSESKSWIEDKRDSALEISIYIFPFKVERTCTRIKVYVA